MEASRYQALYAAEAREHLDLLGRSILALETPTAPDESVGAAFRAAHTLKSAAAAMGHTQVADLAHAIEDRLDAVRGGRARIEPVFVDALLAAVDTLRDAFEASLRPAAKPAADGPARARIALRADTPLMGARAALIIIALKRRALITAAEPETFDEETFDGEFVVTTAPGLERGVVEAAILSAGDVARVAWEGVQTAPKETVAGPALAHVRIDPQRLDALAEGIAELTVLHTRNGDDAHQGAVAGDRTAMLLASLGDEVLRLRLLPVSGVFDRLPRAVRDAARASGREARLEVQGSDIELDRALLDELGDLLLHLVRNAVGHGLERPDEREAADKPRTGLVRVSAVRAHGNVQITVADDGRGIPRGNVVQHAVRLGVLPAGSSEAISDDELLRILTHPGFSTADRVTELSGRGVGLDVVAKRLRALGGAFNLRTEPGVGTTFALRMPVTLALAQALRVRVSGEDYAIPLTHVVEVVEIQDVLVSAVGGRETVRVRDDLLPLIRLRAVLGLPDAGVETAAVVAGLGERRAALAVDELVCREQILIKPFDPARGALPLFSGATLLADGRPALVLDPLSVS